MTTLTIGLSGHTFNTMGKRVLITGGTSGVGKAIARGLAEMGFEVIILGRNSGRGAAAADEIRGKTGNSGITFLQTDLSMQDSIRKFVSDFTERYNRLDVLVNAAGVLTLQRQETRDGIEMTFAVDFLSHFLLTNLLLDLLRESAPSRIITVAGSPGILQKASIDWGDLQFERKKYSGIRAAVQAALARLVFTTELARRLEGSGVTANAFHPGMVRSNLGRNLPFPLRTIARIAMLAAPRSCPTGVYLAASEEMQNVSGKFFANSKPAKINLSQIDGKSGSKLWDIAESMTGLSRTDDRKL